MNSDPIIRELNRMANDRTLTHRHRSMIMQAIQHIKLQDEHILELREDITEMPGESKD